MVEICILLVTPSFKFMISKILTVISPLSESLLVISVTTLLLEVQDYTISYVPVILHKGFGLIEVKLVKGNVI